MSEPLPSLRLLPPRPQPALPPFSPSGQQARAALAAGENLVILGAPRTGKSTLAVQLLIEAVQAGRDALILAPTRARADYLRRRVTPILGTDGGGKVRVRTPAAWALSVVSEFLTARPSPLPAPVLLMGAQEDAALAAMIRPEDWAPLPPEATQTRAFRSELRNLLARAGELGISADDLESFGMPIWNQAAPILRAWDAQGRPTAQRRDQVRKIDSVRLQDRAIEALKEWEREEVFAPRPQPELLIVDDYQDCTAATGRLLRYLAGPDVEGKRTQIVVLGNPDLAVETFRGGTPSLLLQAETNPEIAATRLVLRESYVGVPALAALWEAQAAAIPVSGTALYRYPRLQGAREGVAGGLPDAERSPSVSTSRSIALSDAEASVWPGSAPSERAEPIEVLVASSISQEAAHVARAFRAEHIAAGTPWSDMAVVVRSAGIARQVSAEMSRRGVPVRSSQPAVLFRHETVSAALLDLAKAVLDGDFEMQASDRNHAIAELLTGPLVGISPVELRRLRRYLATHVDECQEAGVPFLDSTVDAIEAPDSLDQRGLDPAQSGEEADEQDGGDGPDEAEAPDGQLRLVELFPAPTAADLLSALVLAGSEVVRTWSGGLTEPSLQTMASSVARGASMLERAKPLVKASQSGETTRVDIEDLLWALWDGSGRAEQWQELALAAGREYSALSEAAERDLDIVTALFKRAEVWSERNPEGHARAFLSELAAEEIPSDSVAPQGVRPEGVEVLTPASAVGRHWPVVAVMGLNADTWPNTRLRDSLLRAGQLVDLVVGNTAAMAGSKQEAESLASARQSVRADERRMFLAALSRASRRLILSSSQDRDSSPSSFFLDVATLLARAAEDAKVEDLTQPRPDVGDLTVRGLTAELRHALLLAQMPEASEELRAEGEAAAALLARLADEGVDVADPQLWAGVHDAPETPLQEPGTPIALSPSAIEQIAECPLRYFLRKTGANEPWTDQAAIGTAIHAVAERAQREGLRGVEELLPAFDEELLKVGLPHYVKPRSHWERTVRAFRIRQITALAEYFNSEVPVGSPAQVEVTIDHILSVSGTEIPGFEEDLPRPDDIKVRIRGRMDRIEYHNAVAEPGEEPPGTPPDKTVPQLLENEVLPKGFGQRVVLRDFKSAEKKPTKAEAVENMQLASYRRALEALGYDVAQATLVYLATTTKDTPALMPADGQLRPSPDEDGMDWVGEKVAFAAQTLSASRVLALSGKHCERCPVTASCPALVDGMVSER